MHFSSIHIAISLPLFAQFVAGAGTDGLAVGWTSNHCDGSEGKLEHCDGGCIDFRGRFSIQTFDPTGPGHCIALYQDEDCSLLVGTALNQGLGSCLGVNTGTPVLSFACFPGNFC
ncbi:hypothetical protein B0H17DRAFT_943813 [Mycena rosella]|uniref:Uncharacterized protein n=1 Tax=Mycena rosella TaxID=1033263 RepID=A0AAD7D589_MYCRO|nr:hypothetical protein B0H17DRAFT_943813 [Mycena rosella]